MRSLPIIFGQQDYYQLLGFSPNLRIADAGCYVDSLAMVARYYGKQTDPVDLNNLLKEKSLFVPGSGLLSNDTDLQEIFPDILFQESLLFPDDPPTPADLEKLKTLMADPTLSVILEINIGNGNTHFVVCLGVNGIVTIANPWTKHIEDFSTHYGDPVKSIIKFVVYKGTPVSVDQQLQDQLREQRDTNWNLYQGQLATAKQLQTQLLEKQNTADSLQQLVTDDEQQITKLKQDIKRITDENESILANYQAKLKEDSTAVEIGIRAPRVIQDLRDYLYMAADALGVERTQKSDSAIMEGVLTKLEDFKSSKELASNSKVAKDNYQQVVTWLLSHGLNEWLTKNKIVQVSGKRVPDEAARIILFLDELTTELTEMSKALSAVSPKTAHEHLSDLELAVKNSISQRAGFFSPVRSLLEYIGILHRSS